MNACLNYFIEANLSLALFLGAYTLILGAETNFKLQRMFLLLGITISLTFPLLHVQSGDEVIPSLGQLMPPYLLPEIVVVGNGTSAESSALNVINGWLFMQLLYILGLLFFFIRFVVRFSNLLAFLKKSEPALAGKVKIVESDSVTPTFSFFNFIVLGQAKSLSAEEKQKVIRHETIHIRQLHSLDILLINILGIFFWFNPLLKTYKKIFVQLHEFEADARAVENREVDEYCNLLAKVALESAGFKLANHFNNSLTLKRIEMMKTIKRKIRLWKVLAIAGMIPLAFVIVACHDQLTDDMAEIARSSTMAVDIPGEVRQQYDELVKANPDKKFLVMEIDENMNPKLDVLREKMTRLNQSQIIHINLITPTAKESEPVRTFAIVEYNEHAEAIQNLSKIEGDIFTIVDETAFPEGGTEVFFEHVTKTLKYPAEARKKGMQGRVFVEFVVNTDGSVDVTRTYGLGAGCNLEAAAVVQSGPKWIPGKSKGVPVRQKMIVPINFKLDIPEQASEVKAHDGTMSEVVVVGRP